jgi:hypothetical protein
MGDSGPYGICGVEKGWYCRWCSRCRSWYSYRVTLIERIREDAARVGEDGVYKVPISVVCSHAAACGTDCQVFHAITSAEQEGSGAVRHIFPPQLQKAACSPQPSRDGIPYRVSQYKGIEWLSYHRDCISIAAVAVPTSTMDLTLSSRRQRINVSEWQYCCCHGAGRGGAAGAHAWPRGARVEGHSSCFPTAQR